MIRVGGRGGGAVAAAVLLGLGLWGAAASGALVRADAVQPSPGTHAAPLDAGSAAVEARNWHMRNGELLKRTWGVDVLGVHFSNSGWMLTFRYTVLDAQKSRVLLDPKATAFLVDESSGARLAVPAMENIGELRQTKNGEEGRAYFIMFGNASRVVQRGSKVDVVIGDFHADGLIVE